MISISIIGSAGRNDDADKLNRDIFIKMYNKANDTLNDIIKTKKIQYSDIILRSGGAAYSDHIAVLLFLKYKKNNIKLELHLPCKYIVNDTEKIIMFVGNNKTASTATKYHDDFNKKCNLNSFNEIYYALKLGATFFEYNGFYARNKHVGNSDYLVAFTFGKNNVPKKGGTKHTWDNSSCKNKIHYSIHNFT
uniref:Uncharacterized protein n=1 Tax=Pithovirus LCPAC101 TaxID=2506586 RepID=A0A481Z408_9VIRU|nr:MAG: uncharacterized protein LCPAC101_00610 [Pithovirus LCPAC101]